MPPIYASGGGAASSGGATITVYSSTALDPQGEYRCDGTADEFQINAAINALPTAGGTVVLSEGKFNLSGPIYINRRAVRLVGQGHDFWFDNTYATSLVRNVNSNYYAVDITSSGDFCTMSDFGIFDNGTTNNLPLVRHAETLTMTRMYIENEASSGRGVECNARLYASYSEFSADNETLYLGNAGTLHISHCLVYNNNAGYAIDQPSTSFASNIQVHHCEIDGQEGGIRVVTAGSFGKLGITNNVIFSYAAAPTIYLDGSMIGQASDNRLGQYGGANNVTVLNNTTGALRVTNNVLDYSGRHGISLTTVSDCMVDGNMIFEPSADTSDTYSGIILISACDRNTIINNRVRRGGSAPHPKYGIRIDNADCDNNWATNNDLYLSVTTAGTGAAFSDAGTSTNTTAGNRDS